MYHAFESLREFLKDRPIGLSATSSHGVREMPLSKRQVSESDDFLTAMQGVAPIARRGSRVPKNGRRDYLPPARVTDGDAAMSRAMEDVYVVNSLNLPEYMEGSAEDINPLVMEKLRAGEYSVQETLDLHGLSVTEAEETFGYFVTNAVRNQSRCIKIIHGRGLKSKDGPVLKKKLKLWMVRAIHRRWVAAFCSARMSDGGPGATLLLLRTKANKRRLRMYG